MKPPSEISQHRILVVDDNPGIHEDFRKILCPGTGPSRSAVANMAEELFGDAPPEKPASHFEMDSAFQGQEAWAKIQAAEQAGRPYSLVFMDVRMPPGWDGVETIKHIWAAYSHIQVVICTAYSDYSWEQMVEQLGETDSLVILKKPFDNVEVLQLAHTLTRKWLVTRQANSRLSELGESVRQRTEELLEANHHLQGEVQRRAKIEAALRESEERFHQAFETVSVPLAIRLAGTGGYLDVNQSFAELCGYSKDELIGHTPEALHLLSDPAMDERIIQNVRQGGKVHGAELLIQPKSGETRQTLASVHMLKLGDSSCLLTALQDVTEQKKLEHQLRQSQKMEAVGQLAAGVAHDFNNLLTIIQGHTSLQLAKHTLDADVAKALTQVKMASERAAALTRQLLAFSRQQVVQRKPLDLNATITQMKLLLGRTLGETIEFECQLAANLPWVNADETNLDQVVMNLVVNARDAMPRGGKLLLSTELATLTAAQVAGHPEKHAGPFVVLSVADTGCGMDPQTLSRIFEPFFTTKPIGRGTGLGLSTVYGIVKQHEGWVEVDSQVGRGTTFRVFLPALAQPTALPVPLVSQPRLASATPEPRPGDAILVVEDEPAVREFVTATLTRQGYQVLQVASGGEALLKWKHMTPRIGLLLTNMATPEGMSGTMLAKHLLRREPGLRVIYTSGSNADAVADGHNLKEGVNLLYKPFTEERLLSTVQNAFGV